jgi:hypothetical protein
MPFFTPGPEQYAQEMDDLARELRALGIRAGLAQQRNVELSIQIDAGRVSQLALDVRAGRVPVPTGAVVWSRTEPMDITQEPQEPHASGQSH